MLTKQSVIDSITVLENGTLQIRRADRILEDENIISQRYHRHCLAPGDSLDGQDEKVVVIATTTWTPEAITAYQASIAQGV